jgi:hypothetical protein
VRRDERLLSAAEGNGWTVHREADRLTFVRGSEHIVVVLNARGRIMVATMHRVGHHSYVWRMQATDPNKLLSVVRALEGLPPTHAFEVRSGTPSTACKRCGKPFVDPVHA